MNIWAHRIQLRQNTILDEGLSSDLSSDAQPYFLLEEIFGIDHYSDILANGRCLILRGWLMRT